MNTDIFNIIIMAGGQGKRMKSDLPKVLHKAGGVPMLVRLIKEAAKLDPMQIIIIVGAYHKIIDDTVKEYLEKEVYEKYIRYAVQHVPLGTGDAVKSALHLIETNSYNLILNGDHPLLSKDTLNMMREEYLASNTSLQITSIRTPNPSGCGRIILNDEKFVGIVEEKDTTPEQKHINLINLGIYLVRGETLLEMIPKIKNENSQKEYYLTDIVEIYRDIYGTYAGLTILPNNKLLETAGVNTKEQLEELEAELLKLN
jgi:bifunctional UDP-N-acetylglucosamine pyrophosphorylase / glucosamine-1-phosphate N-acetyltransferase